MVDITTKPVIGNVHVKDTVNMAPSVYMEAELIIASSSKSAIRDICVNMAPKIYQV